MTRIHWTVRSFCRHMLESIYYKLSIIKITLCSLFYNEFADLYYVGDTCMEPMFWFVDHFTKVLGPICVVGVIILISSIIIIAYAIGLPFWWRQGLIPVSILLLIGHWLLINVVFHYYMAYITLPGYPPEGALIPEAVSICKKCIAPKPPRTHHCSVCNRCILKMDHHCPWLNNCIGHYNHRYFFMFCVFVWMGSIFVMLFGLPVAWKHFTVENELSNGTIVLKEGNQNIIESSDNLENTTSGKPKRTWTEALYHSSIVYAALLCFAAFVAVGALIAWHAHLISQGETSIEGHINKKEIIRLSKDGKVYKNPYDLGIRRNWKLFLGIHNGRSLWHIAFPSTHKPNGNGLQWHTQSSITWPDDKFWKKELAKS